MSRISYLLAAVAALSLLAMILAIGELANGIVEVPRHWWSTLPLLTLSGSAVGLLLTRRPRRPDART